MIYIGKTSTRPSASAVSSKPINRDFHGFVRDEEKDRCDANRLPQLDLLPRRFPFSSHEEARPNDPRG
jgi:hypothetical protein